MNGWVRYQPHRVLCGADCKGKIKSWHKEKKMKHVKKHVLLSLVLAVLAVLSAGCVSINMDKAYSKTDDSKTDDSEADISEADISEADINTEETAFRYEVTDVYDYVVDIGTITEIDYDFIRDRYANGNDLVGGCSAIAKVTDDGTMLVGRNMDLYFSNNPAYVVRTAVDGCYETIGTAYIFTADWPAYEQVLSEGLSEEKYKELPFITTDIMNSEGLYVEINMRYPEFWVSGDSKYACSGTCEDAEERVYAQCIGRYIAEHCATVEEAVTYVNGLDIFTGDTKYSWNYCFMLADATGHYGLLEIAGNKVAWLDFQQCQTNFYIDEELAAVEEYKCGLGRYDYLMSHIESVQSEDELYKLMDQVSYFRLYSEDCPYDASSELVGTYPWWTNDYIADEANAEEIEETISYLREKVGSYDAQTLRDKGTSWQSVFTTVANCNEKTMNVRFFEDETKILTLTLE